MSKEDEVTEKMIVRRHWNDYRKAVIRASKFQYPHWDRESGGVGVNSPHPMVYGYINCDEVEEGELAHSCTHGPAPHRIKVVMVKKDNDPKLVKKMRAEADFNGQRRSGGAGLR